MAISYRKLIPNDAQAYREIRLESLRKHPESFDSNYEEQRKLPKLMLEEQIAQASDDIFAIGAFDHDKLIGICGFIPFGVPETLGIPDAGTIIQMYVKSTYSGRKIGLNLINATIEQACKNPGIKKIVLGVKESNLKAIRVYRQAGFQAYEPELTKNRHQVMVIDCFD